MKAKTKRARKRTKLQMRVAIARDVILQLNTKQLIAEHMTYTGSLSNDALETGLSYNDSLQPYLLKKKRKPCKVCGVGAGLVAVVRIKNEFSVGDLEYGLDPASELRKYFTTAQVAVIESLFESFRTCYALNGVDAENRMRFIWGYIAKRKGRFTAAQIEAEARKFAAKWRAKNS